jgi:broad specificity phosphatase PhoE
MCMPSATPAARVLFVTHPQVTIDPGVPVPDWTLSDVGKERMARFASSPAVARLTAIYCSAERKALESAEILSGRTGVPFNVEAALHENDRSATGYLPPDRFKAVADRFFAEPETSVLGWERAVDAQARIVACVRSITEQDATPGDVAIVAHGGVGALLLAHLSAAPISRRHDQPGTGGGNYFAWRRGDLALVHGWRSIDPG